MKKLIAVLLIAIVTFFSSCKNVLDNDTSYVRVEAKNGDDSRTKVKFFITPELDTLKLDRKIIKKIASTSVLYADWGIKNELTYLVDDGETIGHINSIRFNKQDSTITATVYGSAKNGFGVRGKVSNSMKFDKQGVYIKDEQGFPEILTLEW